MGVPGIPLRKLLQPGFVSLVTACSKSKNHGIALAPPALSMKVGTMPGWEENDAMEAMLGFGQAMVARNDKVRVFIIRRQRDNVLESAHQSIALLIGELAHIFAYSGIIHDGWMWCSWCEGQAIDVREERWSEDVVLSFRIR